MPTPKKRPVTMRMIAEKIGITHATVSLALRDDPRISAERRDEVKRIAQEMEYRPDPLLSQLANYRKSSKLTCARSAIAWVNDWERPEDFYRLIEFKKYHEGATAMAEKLGYHLEVFNTREMKLSSKRLGSILTARGVRGIIIPPQSSASDDAEVEWDEFAVLRIGFSRPDTRRHIVGSDQFEGGRIAAKGMLDAGYRRIGFVSDEKLEDVSRSNFSAGFQSYRNRHVAVRECVPDLILKSQLQADACALYGRWLKKHRVDAVLFRVGMVPQWTRKLGLKVGSDLGLAGTSYHDSGVDSGIDQKPFEIGSVAVQYLSSLVAHREFGVPDYPQRLMVSPAWVTGSSLPQIRRGAKA